MRRSVEICKEVGEDRNKLGTQDKTEDKKERPLTKSIHISLQISEYNSSVFCNAGKSYARPGQ